METENIKGDIKYDKLILLLEVDNVKLMTNNNPIITIISVAIILKCPTFVC